MERTEEDKQRYAEETQSFQRILPSKLVTTEMKGSGTFKNAFKRKSRTNGYMVFAADVRKEYAGTSTNCAEMMKIAGRQWK